MAQIEVNNISKSFTLSHESAESYTALRDVISRKARKVFSFSGLAGSNRVTRELFWALQDVSFKVEPGERIGIIGRNGAGKSTLLKILSRITEPTKGEVLLKGRVASLLEVGTGFHPELSGRENIFLNGAILGMTRREIRARFDEIVEFSGVERFLDTPVKRFSSGMYVRLAFAVAAHLDPEILLVDEVLAVGDAEFQKKCLGKMEDISLKEGRTVLFVSHQMDAIEKLTQRCLFLDNGKVHSVGDTSEVVDEYLHQNVEATDISQYRDRQGSQKARVVKMQVLREGQPAMGVKQGEPFQILIGIETRAEESLDISVVVENARQQALFCSQLSDKQHPSVVSGYAEFTVDVDKPVLRKGDYLISIALFKPDKSEFFDVVLHYPLISVEGMSAALEMPSDNRWGNLYFPLIWTRTGIS